MPFLAPIIPAITGAIGAGGAGAAAAGGLGHVLAGAGIKAGLGIGSSLLAGKLSKSKPTSMEQQVLNSDLKTQQTAQDQSQNLMGMGQNALNPAMNYWAQMLSGNKNQITSAMAPEISRIGQGYQQAGQTSAMLNPRGGPSASFLGEQPYAQQRDVSTLMQQARPQAANQAGSLGMNLLSQGTNLLQTATGAGRNVLEQQRQQKLLEQQRGENIGGGLFDILQKYGFPAIDSMLKGGGGGILGKIGGGHVPNLPSLPKTTIPPINFPGMPG